MRAHHPLPSPGVQPGAHVDRASRVAHLPEALIHDIWERREYDHLHLETTTGQPVLVLETGERNGDAGPDFLLARVLIGSTEWLGDVEIHRTSSEWLQHGHNSDPRYNRAVLHVVLTADLWTGRLRREDGTPLPEIALSGFLRVPLRRLLVRLYRGGPNELPCTSSWHQIPAQIVAPFVAQMAEARRVRRSEVLRAELATTPMDQIIYTRVLRALGYSKNREPMVELSQRVPISVLWRLPQPMDVEALLLGTAGLIPASGKVDGTPDDVQYVDELRTRFESLRGASGTAPMKHTQWRLFRLRPSNFPCIRIAQGAALVAGGLLSAPGIGSRVLEAFQTAPDALAALRILLSVRMNAFWSTHVRLEKPMRGSLLTIGSGRIDHIILNALVPAAVHLAAEMPAARVRHMDRIRETVRSLPPEDDEVTRIFHGLCAAPRHAETTQGLHEIHSRLCLRQGCLRCDIGRFILSR